jgi:hypothetical protein
MEDTLDDEISFLEKSCEKLRRDIERYSTPRDRAQARDSGIHTIIGASADRDINPDETVILPNDASAELENNSTNHVTVRKAKAQNTASGRENLMANALYSYTPRNEVVGGYTGIGLSVRPSVCLSVRPSVDAMVSGL